ncbi:MAG: ATP-binding protein [Acidobacteriota bacterium]|nr:ATP-binding protein [Blastocatellia bacterium]MDW8238738.1 ATP-binding protein [Acidobacteriota bacterium]
MPIEEFITERITIVLPSQLQYVDPVVMYLSDHLTRFGYPDEDCHTAVALHEAITNAMRHGNKLDATKKVEIVLELDAQQAVFIITDEGNGFDPASVCDPTEGENIFRECGRGLLMMRHIMDEVRYNERGNQITMIKKSPKAKSS